MKRILVLLSILFVLVQLCPAQIITNRGKATCDIVPFYEAPITRVTGDPVIQIIYPADSLKDLNTISKISFYANKVLNNTNIITEIRIKEIHKLQKQSFINGGTLVFKGRININNSDLITIPLRNIYTYNHKNLVVLIRILSSERVVCKGTTTTMKHALVWKDGYWISPCFLPLTKFE